MIDAFGVETGYISKAKGKKKGVAKPIKAAVTSVANTTKKATKKTAKTVDVSGLGRNKWAIGGAAALAAAGTGALGYALHEDNKVPQ